MSASAASGGSGPLVRGTASDWSTLWHLAWPLVLTQVINAGIGLLDIWVAGGIDPTSQAAVGLCMQLIMLINATTTACSIGCQALVSRFVGAGNWAEAGRAAQQSLLLGFWITLMIAWPIYAFAPGFFALMGAPAEVQVEGAEYLRMLVAGLLPMDLAILLLGIFRAQGRTIHLMIANGAESAVWAAGSLGLGYFLHWGLYGLAVAFVAGRIAGLWTAWALFRGGPVFEHIRDAWRIDTAWFRRILKVGAPAGIQVLIRNAGMMAFFGILGQLPQPTAAVAAFTMAFRVESLAFLPVFALNIATATLVGQNLGAGRPDQAEKATWQIASVATGLMTVCALGFFFGAEPLARHFSSDPLVVAIGADYLRIIALSEPALGLVMVLNGALQGAGDTRAPMLATLTAQILLRLPAAYLLALPLGWGPSGAWWAVTVSMFAQACFCTWWFRRGTWREKRI